MAWRRTLVSFHRDIGFFSLGLTVVYAVSGIAVNHRQHWDYNFTVSREQRAVGRPSELLGLPAPVEGGEGKLARDGEDALVARLTAESGRPTSPHKAFWRGPDLLSLFFGEGDADVVDYRPSSGVLELTNKADRAVFRDLNFLHLNESRETWTWFGDAYAAALLFLAFSGVLIVKGRKGLWGRGGIYVAIGIVVPIAAIVLLR